MSLPVSKAGKHKAVKTGGLVEREVSDHTEAADLGQRMWNCLPSAAGTCGHSLLSAPSTQLSGNCASASFRSMPLPQPQSTWFPLGCSTSERHMPFSRILPTLKLITNRTPLQPCTGTSSSRILLYAFQAWAVVRVGCIACSSSAEGSRETTC